MSLVCVPDRKLGVDADLDLRSSNLLPIVDHIAAGKLSSQLVGHFLGQEMSGMKGLACCCGIATHKV